MINHFTAEREIARNITAEEAAISMAASRNEIYGVHVSPTKKAKKCRNKKPQLEIAEVSIERLDPNGIQFQDRLASLRAKIALRDGVDLRSVN